MARCKACSKARIVSDVIRTMDNKDKCCQDVCATPICKDPSELGIMAPLIYDEIGINLCTDFDLGVDIATTYPTVTNAKVKVIDATFTYGDGNVQIEAITGRPNCYAITLSNISVQFAVSLYDASCRLVATIYPTAVYLPTDTTAPTYDEDTNPTSVQLEIFAPYGLTYSAGATPEPVLNFVGSNVDNNMVRQGVNLFGMAKVLGFSLDDNSVTVGLTLVLQSLYYVGYKVKSAGKINIPKGSIVTPEDSDCMKFVAGELLNLAIKPLDLSVVSGNGCGLGNVSNETGCKQTVECQTTNCQICRGGTFSAGCSRCANGAADDTVVISGGVTTTPPADGDAGGGDTGGGAAGGGADAGA